MADTKTLGKNSGSRELRDASINIRVQRRQRDLIDRAVKVLGKNRSDFMLEAACKEAENVLLDRRYFALEQKAFNQFLAALDKAPANNERLRRTLASQAPWEK
ncbi:MAG: DUF1778 domain-containing protein [Nitrospinales bacterium]